MAETLPISVTILTKNSQSYLAQCLNALKDFDEIIVLDNGSTDDTLAIAQQYHNVVIHYHDFVGFGEMKNLAASLAKNDWIINIDSDEIFTPELIQEIRQLDLSNPHRVYAIPRINHYRGKPIKTCGWYPDYVKRLYHKSAVQFNHKKVHESLQLTQEHQIINLTQPFLHYSFANAEGLISKMQQYTSLFAEQQKFRKRASLLTAIGHGISAFVKNYIVKKGVLSGADGFVISFANASGSYYKYVKLAEANQTLTAALIITTYNRPDALEAVLYSVLAQKVLPQEVIIADDGSSEQTQQVIKDFQAQPLPFKLKHAWQPDDGFRLAQSRNRALAMVESDYVIVIDGDMLLHPDFIADHKNVARKGLFVQGGRVILTEQKTKQLLANPRQYRPLKFYEKDLEKRLEKRLSALHLPWLSAVILAKELRNEYQGIRGCNMAFFKQDAVAINGFNNDFIGWGREDSEFVARFYNNGGKRANLKFAGIAYHLWHHEAERDSLPENDKLLNMAMNQKLVRCANGLEQLQPINENKDIKKNDK
ncbi:galactosyltransferase-like protein [Volucribacter psittacicida]|uniref:Galactosyltransferase-like protein n=1 Tax=Volucribacter psittacicida TaxID=203482 RepID=A0A4R1FUW9_9PAST|nr:glycosyltransferase [Volucribacter psittacicida]TCJ98623.1 galactosyltransferase-like protein [Volucribacter psittacicida]